MKARWQKPVAIIILLLLIIITCGSGTDFQYEKQGVVLITGGEEERYGSITGFVVGSRDGDWYVVTNNMIDEDYLDEICLWRSEAEVYSTKQILSLDDYGVNVHRIIGNPSDLRQMIINSDPDVTIGDILTVLGFSGEDSLNDSELAANANQVQIKTVVTSGVVEYEGLNVFIYNTSGLSERTIGSPVLDGDGRVVGINIYLGGDQYGAVEISNIVPQLENAGIKVDTGMPRSSRVILMIVGIAIVAALLVFVIIRFYFKKGIEVIGVAGFYTGKSFKLKKENIVFGRDPTQCNVVYPPDIKGISRRHCEIYYNKQAKRYILMDLSSQGTFLSGKRMEGYKPYTLGVGLEFYLGDKSQMFAIKQK